MFDYKLVAQCRVSEMKVEFNDDKNVPEPLFRMEESGSATGESYGVACARKAHVPEHVLQRATQVSERVALRLPLVLRASSKRGGDQRSTPCGPSAASVVDRFSRIKDWRTARDDEVEELMKLVETVAKSLM